jgi:hypothetical protein
MAADLLGGPAATVVADALIHPLNLRYPETRGVTDHDPEEMLATRLACLRRPPAKNALVATSHFRFPGLGYVKPKGDRWECEPFGSQPIPGCAHFRA